jgi:hypothetical protein
LRERLVDVRNPVRREEAMLRNLRERLDEETKIGSGLTRMISLLGEDVEARAEARHKLKQCERQQAKLKLMVTKHEAELEAARAANPQPAAEPAVAAAPAAVSAAVPAAKLEVPPGAVCRVRATCDCEASRAGDLSFKEGDEFIVLAKVTANIWKGTLNGRVGRFLSRTVEVVEEYAPTATQ